ncbi:MAG: helix-turn-helix domain-containing protein [Clostridia bacterium]|nr:helix-turn-helix domain-containing protein [Clostridia bacterium]
MNDFAEFLFKRRKELGLTQQNIADELGISNKAVSKWESGESFPETAQLLPLSRLLGCSVDDLLAGRFSNQSAEEDKHDESEGKTEVHSSGKNSLWTALGVFSVLLGVFAQLVFGYALGGDDKAWEIGASVMLALIAVGVVLMVYAGLSKEIICRADDEEKNFANKYSLVLSLSIGGTIFAVASLIFCIAFGLPEVVSVGVMFLLIAISVSMIVYSGMRLSKFKPEKKTSVKEDNISGIIMMTATAVYLLIGFIWGKWHPGWVIFPVSGILCGIISIIIKTVGKK